MTVKHQVQKSVLRLDKKSWKDGINFISSFQDFTSNDIELKIKNNKKVLKFVSYHIVFREVPGEVTLAINLSNCPNRCKGCHSPDLQENTGQILDKNVLANFLDKYGNAITCVCFMGGDASPREVEQCSVFLRNQTNGRIKTAWYSGKNSFPQQCSLQNFDYIKLGAYMEHLGGLDSKTTNQRFYRVDKGRMINMPEVFFKKEYSK